MRDNERERERERERMRKRETKRERERERERENEKERELRMLYFRCLLCVCLCCFVLCSYTSSSWHYGLVLIMGVDAIYAKNTFAYTFEPKIRDHSIPVLKVSQNVSGKAI